MTYRADIDGLRAVAVMAVFCFHVGVALFPGGYVGVDVFFVISGYLISAAILSEAAGGHFSIVRFYQRRLGRILPALFAMLACVSVLACYLLLPTRLAHFGTSLMASALSLSNLYFWSLAGYFDSASATAPLLHTWSLGVEEQFYVLWPMILMGIHRTWPGRVRLAILAVVILSLAASAIGSARGQSAAFYLLHSRAWELGLGALLATGAVRLPERRGWREMAAAGGLALVLWGCFTYDSFTPFPGLAALPPCLGSALVILAGMPRASPVPRSLIPPSMVERALSLPAVVLIGRISYSLYLWHWPIIIFKDATALSFSASPKIDKSCVLLLGLTVAWLSWRFIERPFRAGGALSSPLAVFTFAGAAVACASVISGVLVLSSGLAWRYPPDVIATAAYLDYSYSDRSRTGCFVPWNSPVEGFDIAKCLTHDAARKNMLLIGDSHAAHLSQGLVTAFPEINFAEATSNGCRPLVGAARPPGKSACDALMQFIFNEYLLHARLDGVILSAKWEANETQLLAPTLDLLRKYAIPAIVIGPIMTYKDALPLLLATGMLRRDAGYAAAHTSNQRWELDARLQAIAANHGAQFVSLLHLLCPAGTCLERSDDGAPLQFDNGHLTAAGSETVGRRMRKVGLFR